MERRKLGEVLVDAGVLTGAQVIEALADRRDGERLGEAIVRLGMASQGRIAVGLAAQLGLSTVDADALTPDAAALELIPGALAARHRVLPLAVDEERFVVAIADPLDVVALDDLAVLAGDRLVDVRVAAADRLADAIEQAYRRQAGAAASGPSSVDRTEEADPERAAQDAPIVRLVASLLDQAVRERASDVHLEPSPAGLRVRFRVDGLLRDSLAVPAAASTAVVSRIKLVSGMDISERRRPQDGRFTHRYDLQTIEVRAASMPGTDGESVVLRLLSSAANRPDLDDLGFDQDTAAKLRRAITQPQGLVVVTGPTGSGKTSTMYAALAEVVDSTRKVITLEDPVETRLDGAHQTQIDRRSGVTFAAGVRAALRLDPDVVMVGEVRDHETASAAFEAAATGHLVLTTMHTNDAPSALTRARDLGVESYMIADAVRLIVAQRLVRKVCRACAVADTVVPAVRTRLSLPSDLSLPDALTTGRGCDDCGGTGYAGRIAIGEVVTADPDLLAAVAAGRTDGQVRSLARASGTVSLRARALGLALDGVTDLLEVARTTPDDPDTTLTALLEPATH